MALLDSSLCPYDKDTRSGCVIQGTVIPKALCTVKSNGFTVQWVISKIKVGIVCEVIWKITASDYFPSFGG